MRFIRKRWLTKDDDRIYFDKSNWKEDLTGQIETEIEIVTQNDTEKEREREWERGGAFFVCVI